MAPRIRPPASAAAGGSGSSLAVASWDGDSYEYLDGEPPTTTQVIFVGPDDPTTAPGGRNVAGDVWIDDTATSGATLASQIAFGG